MAKNTNGKSPGTAGASRRVLLLALLVGLAAGVMTAVLLFAVPGQGDGIWVHAVSVGETIAAAPMIRRLQERYPSVRIVVTTMTPTGSERVRALFGDSVDHVYAPYDVPDCIARFLNRTRPQLAIVVETELWPNLYHACRARAVPLLLASARLSERSSRR